MPLLFASGRKTCIAAAGNVSSIDVAEVDRSKNRTKMSRLLRTNASYMRPALFCTLLNHTIGKIGFFWQNCTVGQGQSPQVK